MTKNKDKIDPKIIREILKSAGDQEVFGSKGFFQELKKSLVNEILEGEMSHHLGYGKHSKEEKAENNRRNGSYKKDVQSDGGHLELRVPRDREGNFEPQLIPKGIRRFDGFDEKVISLYARGMSVREIQGHLEEIYSTEVSPDLISTVTDTVLEEVKLWQNRGLSEVYPVIYLDCIHAKCRDHHMIQNKAVYLVVGITMEGQKELLGMWISKNEGAKFWMQVVTELKNRGVKDILIACVDGLKGFEEAILSVFPNATVQLCIVHLVRNSLKFVPWKDRKLVAEDLRYIYNAPSESAARDLLEVFKEKWGSKYPTIGDMWERNWLLIIPCLAYPAEIKKAIYTTNIIESINRQIRKIIKAKGVFPHDDAIMKIFFLTLNNAQKKWTMPIRNWPQALNQFAVLFPDRIKF